MKNFIRALVWFAGLSLIMVVALVVTVATLDPNDHKDWISKKAQEKTGRTLAIAGDINITLYPWLGLEASGVTVGNAPGFADTPFMKMDYVNVRIETMPLLREVYNVDTVKVKGAEIHLARNESGTNNWADLLAAEPDEKKPATIPLAAIALGGVDVERAVITWNDQQAGVKQEIRDLNITTAELKYGEPVSLDLGFHAVSNKPELNAAVDLHGILNYDTDAEKYNLAPLTIESVLKGKNIPGGETTATLATGILLNLDKDTATISKLSLQALGTKVNASVEASRVSTPGPGIKTTLDIAGDDLSAFFKVLEIEPLASQIAELNQRSFTVTTDLTADLQRGDVNITTLNAELLGATIEGQVKARNVQSDKAEFTGKLNAAGPNLPTLMGVLGQLQGGKNSALSVYGEKMARVPNKAFVIKTDFSADMGSGNIKVTTLDIDTLGIKIDGVLDATNVKSSKGKVTGSLTARAEKMTGLLRAFDQPELGKVLQTIDFETRLSGSADNVIMRPLQFNAVFSGKDIPNSPVKVTLDANTAVDLASEKLQLEKFSLAGMGLNLSGQVTADKFLSKPSYRGQLSLAQLDLRKLMTQLEQTLPKMADNKTLRKVSLSSKIEGNDKKLSLTGFKLLLDETTLQGDLGRNLVKGKDHYTFNLTLDAIDLDRYLPPKVEDAGKPPGKKQGKAAPQQQQAAKNTATEDAVPVELLRKYNLDGSVAVGRLKVGNVRVSNIKWSIKSKDGLINLDPISAELYEGKFNGNIKINATKKLPRLTINSSLKGINAKPLLEDASGAASLHGRGDFNLALVAAGLNAPTIKRTLNGQGEMNVRDGLFIGVDVNKVLQQVEIMFENKNFLGYGNIDKGTQTRFDRLSGSFNINGGVVNNNDLLMTAPGFRVTGKGVLANLVQETWKYDLKVDVPESRTARGKNTYNVGGYDIPIRCRGKIVDQNCKPDIGDIAKTLVEKTFLEKLQPKKKSTEQAPGAQQEFNPLEDLLKKIQ